MINISPMKKDLTLQELGVLESEMLKKQKNKEAAWGLWAGLSFFGAHRFYTENYAYASAMLLTTSIPLIVLITLLVIGMISFLFYTSLIFVIGSVIWSWIDAFFLNARIDQLNNQIEENILKAIKSQR